MMKKIVLMVALFALAAIKVQAQIQNNFAQEVQALIDADIEKLKGAKDEKLATVGTAYQSTLLLSGFKVVLKETFGDYRVSCTYNGNASGETMDIIAKELIKLKKRFMVLDSKEHSNLSEGSKDRRIVVVDIAEHIKADVKLLEGTGGLLILTVYKFDRNLFNK